MTLGIAPNKIESGGCGHIACLRDQTLCQVLTQTAPSNGGLYRSSRQPLSARMNGETAKALKRIEIETLCDVIEWRSVAT